MTDLCPHDGDPHTCPPCQRKKGLIVDDGQCLSHAFTARWDGHCPSCSLPIYVGQQIRITNSAARHDGCAD